MLVPIGLCGTHSASLQSEPVAFTVKLHSSGNYDGRQGRFVPVQVCIMIGQAGNKLQGAIFGVQGHHPSNGRCPPVTKEIAMLYLPLLTFLEEVT